MLKCDVLVHVYNGPCPCVDYLVEGIGFVEGEWVEGCGQCRGHDGALYIPPSGAFVVSVECVVELVVGPVLEYFLSL